MRVSRSGFSKPLRPHREGPTEWEGFGKSTPVNYPCWNLREERDICCNSIVICSDSCRRFRYR